ncbi:MAG: histone deacetylase [Anaerolineales bacterium]|nr:histone deacetylase [Anaerolineales bacterium]MCW5854961.1 histone deacetylase [Anaerolineales bacterium]
MHPIAFTYPEGHQAHHQPGHAERPERIEALQAALQAAGYWARGSLLSPIELDPSVLTAIHTPHLLASLPEYAQHHRPFDEDTYLNPASWPLALRTAGAAAALAAAVWRREAAGGLALTRPPGHHATPERAMGFCILNNIALAAQHLLQHQGAQRLAIIDLDVHHGNGTQDIFYEREDVLFISSHQIPLYPGSGSLDERGRGPGDGFTVNLPLPPGSGDAAFRVAYDEIVPSLLDRFQPEMLLVSLGLDAHWQDPLAELRVSAAGYGAAVHSLQRWASQHCGGRIALILEGGYDLDGLAASSLCAVQALLGEEIRDPLGPGPDPENDGWLPVFDQVRRLWNL